MVTWGKEGTVSRSINVLSFHNGGVYENLGVCFTIFLLINFIYLFIYFWLHCVFIAARGLSLFVASSSCSPLQCVGLSAWWPLSLQSTGSKHAGVSSCGVWAHLLCGTWMNYFLSHVHEYDNDYSKDLEELLPLSLKNAAKL